MRSCLLGVSLSVSMAVLAGSPTVARAWTDAAVHSASARVTLSDDAATVHVELTAELRVDGGWLESFELDGLDESLVLDPAHPPVFERWALPEVIAGASDDGTPIAPAPEVDASRAPVLIDVLSPRVATRGSRVTFSFPRRSAPRRGLYRARVTYDAPATIVAAPDHAELVWSLPSWRNGLDGVHVIVVAPPGSAAPPIDDIDEGALEVATSIEDGRVVIDRVRMHLPRTRPWVVRTVLPPSFWAPLEEAPAELEPSATPVLRDEPTSARGAVALALGLALWVLAVSLARSRDARTAGASAPGWIPMPLWARVGAIALALVATIATILEVPAWTPLALAALALLGVHRAVGVDRASMHVGSFRSAWGRIVRASLVERARWLRGRWLDGTSWPGLIVLGVIASGIALAIDGGELDVELGAPGVASIALVSISGTPRSRSAGASLGALLAWAEGLTLDLDSSLAIAPLVHVDIRGRVQAARLRLSLPTPPDGLTRFDVVLDEAGRTALVLAARSGSRAAASLVAIAADLGLAVIELDPTRIAVSAPTSAIGVVARALGEAAPASAPALAASA